MSYFSVLIFGIAIGMFLGAKLIDWIGNETTEMDAQFMQLQGYEATLPHRDRG